MIIKTYADDGMAHTLETTEVYGPSHIHETGVRSFTHSDGWTITGLIHENYYMWVNDFTAYHIDYGTVAGDFEYEVTATSEEGLADFIEKHGPRVWDYGDI
jgi:hypothetical protein